MIPFGTPRPRFPVLALFSLMIVLAFSSCTQSAPAVEQGWAAPLVDSGSVFIGSRVGKFFKISVADVTEVQPLNLAGKNLVPQWQFPAGTDPKGISLGAIYGRPEVNKNTVYIAINRVEKGVAKTGQVSALDKETGIERWSYTTEGRVFGSPVLSGTNLYICDDAGNAYALDATGGGLIWKEHVATKRFWTTPTIAGKAGTIYVGSMDKHLYALDLATGKVKWTFEAKGAITSRPLVIGDGVYVGAFDRNFYRIDAATGKQVWVHAGDGWFWNDAVASADGVSIYVGSLGHTFYALDASTGNSRWTFETGSPVRATPVLVGNLVYVIAESGQIYVLDASTGDQRRSAPVLGAQALASPAWFSGFLFVHDMKEMLHKIAAPA